MFLAHARITLTSLTNFGGKRCRAIGEKDALLQNTLSRNNILIKEVFFRKHNKVTEEVVVFRFYYLGVFFFFHSLGFPIDGSHFFPPKNRAVAHIDQNKNLLIFLLEKNLDQFFSHHFRMSQK